MVQVQRSDLECGKGTKTGLPSPLCGGMKLGTPEMPGCAVGRTRNGSPIDVELSYPMARGCVKLLEGDIADVEILADTGSPYRTAIHLVLSNGTSHAWVLVDDSPDGSGLVLKLSGMPFSSQLVNYNSGIALGLFLMSNRDAYPDFCRATAAAVDAWSGTNESRKAETLAAMADEMAFALEQMMDSNDPMSIRAVVMDREKPEGYETVIDGGRMLREAFASPDGYRNLVGDGETSAHIDEPVPAVPDGFLGDLTDKLEDCIRRGKHVLLTGPTATGKTLAVEEVCIRLGAPLTVIRGSEGLEDRDMIGATILTAEQGPDGVTVSSTRFVPGPLPQAMALGRTQHDLYLKEQEAAKQDGREAVYIPPSVLLIDEVNRLQLRHQNFLVSMLNVRKAAKDYYLRIPDTNEEVTCPDSFLVIIAARNVGSAFLGTNPVDLALERGFYKKIDLEYLPQEQESALVRARTGLDEKLTRVVVKVAADTRHQLSQLRAPVDTDTLLKWAEELAHLKATGITITDQTVLDTARDVLFDIALERSERGGFDPAGEAVLTDNISENWRDVFSG